MFRLSLCVTWLLVTVTQGQVAGGAPSANEIVAKLEGMNALRAHSQIRIACERTYVIDYQGFPGAKHAEMHVHAEQQGDEKSLIIVDESGSAVLRTKVLHKLLDGEREASEPAVHAGNMLTRTNYNFSLEGVQQSQSQLFYILDVAPKASNNRFAWKGRVWVDSVDYAVVRAEGEPERLPSWWTTHSEFRYTNQKIEGLWVPKQNISDTRVRMGGHAHLQIEYGACQNIAASDGQVFQ